jgi:Flp pilus assembly protein TadG
MLQLGINRRRLLDCRGTTLVETAIVANVLFMLLLGCLELGRYFFVSESLKYLVGELARAAMLDPDADWSAQKSLIVARAPILRPADFSTLDVAIARAAAPALTTVTVTAAYRYSSTLPVLSGLPNSINSGLTVRFVAP